MGRYTMTEKEATIQEGTNRYMEETEEVINCDADAETKCKMKGYDGTCPVCGRNVFSGLKKCQCWHCDNDLIWENGRWKRKLMNQWGNKGNE